MEHTYDKNKELKYSAFIALNSNSSEKDKITEFYIRIEELKSNVSKLLRIKKQIKKIDKDILNNKKIINNIEYINKKINDRKSLEDKLSSISVLKVLIRSNIKKEMMIINNYIEDKIKEISNKYNNISYFEIQRYIIENNKKLNNKKKKLKEKYNNIINIEKEYNPKIEKYISKDYIDSLSFDDLY